METFADYILEEEKLDAKMEIAYYLSKKQKVHFDKSVVFKVEIARLFLNYANIDVDKNFVLTACLLCNCKKIENAQDLEKIKSYAKEGAEYLREMGFGKRFCKVCEEMNRYSGSVPREKESDVLELVDQFGGMLIDKPERIGFQPDEALVLLEYRNLKDKYNRYLSTFIEFVNFMEKVQTSDSAGQTPLRKLIKIYKGTNKLTDFIKKVVYDYEPKIDSLLEREVDEVKEEMFKHIKETNRPLFSEETTKKVMAHIYNNKETVKSSEES